MHYTSSANQRLSKTPSYHPNFNVDSKKSLTTGKYGFVTEEDQELMLDRINGIVASGDSARKTELFELMASTRWSSTSAEQKLISLMARLTSSDTLKGAETLQFLFEFIERTSFASLGAQIQLINDIKRHAFSEDPQTLHFLGHLICKFQWSLNETNDELIRLICKGPFLKSDSETLIHLFQFIPQWCETDHSQILFARAIQAQAFGTQAETLDSLLTTVSKITWENQHAFNIVSMTFPGKRFKIKLSENEDSVAFTLSLPHRTKVPSSGSLEYLDLSGLHATITIKPNHTLDEREAFLTIHREDHYAFQYSTRTDFCKNILVSFPQRQCIHIVSYRAFSSEQFHQILEENPGHENIVYYFWNSKYHDKLSHVSAVYIDRRTKKIFYLPAILSKLLTDLAKESQALQKLGYQLCLPAGTFFTGGRTQRAFDTMQQDSTSCSFLASQFAQKIEHMQNEPSQENLIVLDSIQALLRDKTKVSVQEQGQVFSYDLKFDETETAPFKTYLIPNAFYGSTQRSGFLILNEALCRIYRSQGRRVPESPNPAQLAEKNARRALWTLYFEMGFETDRDMSKYEKTVSKLLDPEGGFEVDHSQKTSPLRKLFDPFISHLSEENKDDALQMAKDVYSLFGLLPTQEFFSAINCRDSREQQKILHWIAPKAS